MSVKELSELSRALAVLVAEEEKYAYVDKLSYAPSRDLAIFYLREALRDLHSLSRKTDLSENVKSELDRLKSEDVEKAIERAIDRFLQVGGRGELRELTSFVAAKALIFSARLKLSKAERGG